MDADVTMVNTFIMLSHMWRGGEYGYFWRLSDKKTRWEKLGTAYQLPEGNDIYWGVHATTCIPAKSATGEPRNPAQVRGQASHVASVGGMFAEFDGKDFAGSKELALTFIRNRLFIAPSAIIDSGGGYHCYFFLDTAVMINDTNRAYMDGLQKRFVHLSGGDMGARDMARVLRVPGTFNTKYPQPRRVEFVEFSRVEYPLAEIVSLMGAAKPVAEPANPILPPERTRSSSAGLGSFMHGAAVGERNRKLFWAAAKMYDKGADIGEVTAELEHAAIASGLTKHEVNATIKSASAPTNRRTVT